MVVVPFSPPDLQVAALSAPNRVIRGQPFEATYTVENLAGATAAVMGIEALRRDELQVKSLQEYHRDGQLRLEV